MRGKYIVLDGGHGAGITTQAELLVQNLSENNLDAVYIQEPGSTPFARQLRRLIKHGPERTPMANVLAFNAARTETIAEIEQALSLGKWVVADRSYLSTLAYQGYGEGQDIEAIRAICGYAMGATKPDLAILLEVSPETAAVRLEERDHNGDYFEDMSSQFHDKVRDGYRSEAQLGGHALVDGEGSETEVAGRIWQLVKPLADPAYSGGKQESSGYLKKANGRLFITDAGKKELSKYLTNTDGDVYAFTSAMNQVTVAAAMARLSRRSDDMRITLLDEFIGRDGKDEDLLKRVITAYGDDSVQQLVGTHFVVENASNLLTKKLEWGRLASYLEQSTRYIYFDDVDEQGRYKYYAPKTLDDAAKQIYEKTMQAIFDTYSNMVRTLTNYIAQNATQAPEERDAAWRAACRAQACDAARPLLPVATKATVGIFASGQATESLITHLMSDPTDEARRVGQQILNEARQVIPAFLERADKPDRGGANIAYKAQTRQAIRALSEEHLSMHSGQLEAANLADVSLRNELDLVPYMLYESSSLSLEEIQRDVGQWPVKRKLEAFETYMGNRLNRRQKPGRALEHVHYTWDIVCDYGIFRDLQRHRMVDGMEWQALTPRYGYDVPQLVDDAGLSELFERGFDLSLELYNYLSKRGFVEDAQYATLLGHRMRWKVTYNARQAFHLHELRTAPQGHPGYRKLVNQMHARIAEVHPNLAAAMRFVNQDEDPELTRLAAERYTQFKLEQLENQKRKTTREE